jgi:hypothetical protein
MNFAFAECPSLQEIVEMPLVCGTMSGTFSGCYHLKRLPNLPKSGYNMSKCFENCTLLEEVPPIADDIVDMTLCFSNCRNLKKAPLIPNSVRNITGCFQNCYLIEQAPEIPFGVNDISSCFNGCAKLSSVPAIPDSVTTMNGTFKRCSVLEDAPSLPTSVSYLDYCFSECINLKKAPSIPDKVVSMVGCFQVCQTLTKAPVIPAAVTYLEATFKRCTSLIEVPVIPSGVTNLTDCFYNCIKLETIHDWQILDMTGVSVSGCFYNCSSLKAINVSLLKSDRYKLIHLSQQNGTLQYSFINSDNSEFSGSTTEVTSVSVSGLMEELAVGPVGSISKETAKTAFEKKIPFSNLDKDFNIDDPHMILWAKDKSKVKTNITNTGLAIDTGVSVYETTCDKVDFNEIEKLIKVSNDDWASTGVPGGEYQYKSCIGSFGASAVTSLSINVYGGIHSIETKGFYGTYRFFEWQIRQNGSKTFRIVI